MKQKFDDSVSQSSQPRGVRVKSAAAMLDIGVSTFWRYVQQGRLPPGIHLSPRCTVWLLSDLEDFLSKNAASRDA